MSESPDIRKRRIGRLARNQGLVVVDQAKDRVIIKDLMTGVIMDVAPEGNPKRPVDLGVAEAWLNNRDRTPGGKA